MAIISSGLAVVNIRRWNSARSYSTGSGIRCLASDAAKACCSTCADVAWYAWLLSPVHSPREATAAKAASADSPSQSAPLSASDLSSSKSSTNSLPMLFQVSPTAWVCSGSLPSSTHCLSSGCPDEA